MDTKTSVATCGCDGVTWRLNIGIVTHDFPPFAWGPETIRQDALRALDSGLKWHWCKEGQKLWDTLVSEFKANAMFASVLEV